MGSNTVWASLLSRVVSPYPCFGCFLFLRWIPDRRLALLALSGMTVLGWLTPHHYSDGPPSASFLAVILLPLPHLLAIIPTSAPTFASALG
ncbi:hypothetical protein PUV47_19545, partial [Pseudovibrio exalbescens]|uniref:hypothetical protein n=1 Tax=Pseudovibrio exalbescens TaxID=197461 RepID=UPI002365908D